jgi:hypothetical protein
MRVRIAVAVLIAVLAGCGAPSPGVQAQQEVKSLRTHYMGNSFTGNTMPGMHPPLGESAGKDWKVTASIAAGVPIWSHMRNQMIAGDKPTTLQKDGAEIDAIVMLIFGSTGLSRTVTEMWQGKIKFDKPTDIGDVAACSYLIREHLKLNPEARAYIYTAWPGIPGIRSFHKRVKEEALKSAMAQAEGKSRQEVMKTIKHRDLTHEEMEPLRKAYDYPSHWLTENYVPNLAPAVARRFGAYRRAISNLQRRENATESGPEALAAAAKVMPEVLQADLKTLACEDAPVDLEKLQTAISAHLKGASSTHSRKHMYLVMEALKKNFPELWKQGRLGMVPVGDVFLALDKKMKAGDVPGIVNIGEFSADGGHLRSGLPRYVLAATYYAVLFKDHPKSVDWKLFQDRSNFDSKKFGFYVHQPDLAVHLDITPARAEVINDTIWEVVAAHPYTGVKAE